MLKHIPVVLMLTLLVGMLPALDLGDQAPSLKSNKTYNTDSGDAIELTDQLGKVVLIDFWATWCGPCIAAMPHMVELHNKYADKGLVIIAHTDSSSTDIAGFIKKNNMAFVVSVASGRGIGDNFDVRGIPRAFLLDTQGKILWEGHSASVKEKDIEKALEKVSPLALRSEIWPSFEPLSENSALATLQNSIAKGKVGSGWVSLEQLLKKEDDNAAEINTIIDTLEKWSKRNLEIIQNLYENGNPLVALEKCEERLKALSKHNSADSLKKLKETIEQSKAYKAGKSFTSLERRLHGKSKKVQQATYTNFAKAYPDTYFGKIAQSKADNL